MRSPWATMLSGRAPTEGLRGKQQKIPVLRTWLGGSAGSGKSTTLKAVVQHARLLFQERDVRATIELTAYTGVAAFNIGFGAKTACSCFKVFPNAPFYNELEGEAFRKLEEQWRHVVSADCPSILVHVVSVRGSGDSEFAQPGLEHLSSSGMLRSGSSTPIVTVTK